MTIIEWGKKDLCHFFMEIRKVIADMNSIKVNDVYMDIMLIAPEALSLYFTAIFNKKAISKMPMLNTLGKMPKIFASDLAKILLEDNIALIKARQRHTDMVYYCSL